MKVIFITDRTLRRFRTIENLNEILNPRIQDPVITIDGSSELRTRSWELSKALFGEDFTLGIHGEVDRKFVRSGFKEEKGIAPTVTVLSDTVYVNVSSPSNAINLSVKDKVILASDILDIVSEVPNGGMKTMCVKLKDALIENTYRTL